MSKDIDSKKKFLVYLEKEGILSKSLASKIYKVKNSSLIIWLSFVKEDTFVFAQNLSSDCSTIRIMESCIIIEPEDFLDLIEDKEVKKYFLFNLDMLL